MLPSQVIYATEKELKPTYKYLNVYLNNNSTNQLISQNANGVLGEMKTPADTVFNLSRSYIEFIRNVTAPGVAAAYTWSPEDVIADIDQISLSNASNVYICNHQNAALHQKIARPLATKPDVDYFKKVSGDNLYPSNQLRNKTTLTVTTGTAVFSGEMVSGAAAGLVTTTKNYNIRTPAVDTQAASNASAKLFNIEDAAAYDGSIINYLEPKHLVCNEAKNAAWQVTKRIPLSAYKDTIFELDKDLVFPNEMYLRFKTAPAKNVVFTSTSNLDPSAGAAAFTGTIEYTGIVLRLAIQNTNDLIDLVKSAYNAGKLKLTIPWVENRFNSVNVAATGAANQVNTNTMIYKVSFNSQFGKRLRQCMTTLVNRDGANGGNLMFDNHNWNGHKCAELQTYFNDKRNFDDVLNCAFTTANAIQSDDWKHNQMFCSDSLYFNEAVYKLNWFHIDKWASDKEDDPNKEEGLILGDKDDTYGIQIKVNNSSSAGPAPAKDITAHIFLTFLRELTISPNLPNRIELL